jgi:hypothetical protein
MIETALSPAQKWAWRETSLDGRAEARGGAQSTFGSEAANTAEFYEEWMVKNEKRPI